MIGRTEKESNISTTHPNGANSLYLSMHVHVLALGFCNYGDSMVKNHTHLDVPK